MKFIKIKRLLTLEVILSIVTWMVLFVAGITLSSSVYFNKWYSIGDLKFFESLLYLFLIIISWTWTNTLLLGFFASLVGEYGRSALTKEHRNPNFRAAIVRSFVIFLIAASGQLVLIGSLTLPGGAEDPVNVSQPRYFRIALAISLICFLVSFSPGVFDTILKKIKDFSGNSQDK